MNTATRTVQSRRLTVPAPPPPAVNEIATMMKRWRPLGPCSFSVSPETHPAVPPPLQPRGDPGVSGAFTPTSFLPHHHHHHLPLTNNNNNNSDRCQPSRSVAHLLLPSPPTQNDRSNHQQQKQKQRQRNAPFAHPFMSEPVPCMPNWFSRDVRVMSTFTLGLRTAVFQWRLRCSCTLRPTSPRCSAPSCPCLSVPRSSRGSRLCS